MLHNRRSFTLVLFTFLASCGSAVTEGAGAGVSGGSSSGGGGSSTTSGTGSVQTDCPPEEPDPGAACGLPDNGMCTYGGCCGVLAVCVEGKWEQGFVDCAPADCPAAAPAAGAACGECALYQVSPCGYSCDQGTSILAECTGGTWQITASMCTGQVVCGEVTCAPGEICVETAGGPGISYSCVENPCGEEPLSCDCAGDVCGGDPFECHILSGEHMSCVCPICP